MCINWMWRDRQGRRQTYCFSINIMRQGNFVVRHQNRGTDLLRKSTAFIIYIVDKRVHIQKVFFSFFLSFRSWRLTQEITVVWHTSHAMIFFTYKGSTNVFRYLNTTNMNIITIKILIPLAKPTNWAVSPHLQYNIK